MRIAFRGRRSLADVKKCLIETLDLLESRGATHTTGTNFYVNLCDEAGEKLFPLGHDGKEIEIWEVPAPRKAKPAEPSAEKEDKAASSGANVVPFPRRKE